jgi:hypothetical protein
LDEVGYRSYIVIAIWGMPQWRGRRWNSKPPRTSNIISPGYDFPKSLERKSASVAFVEESPILIQRTITISALGFSGFLLFGR